MSEPNPYSSPAALEDPDRSQQLRSLRAPGLGLLVLSVIWGGIGLIGLVALAAWFFLATATNSKQVQALAGDLTGRDNLQLVLMLPSCFIAYGALCMRSGRHYRAAWAAALLSCVPMLSPMIWFGIPFGIWALIVLRRPAVRNAFATAPQS
jgi:hypothetical protein